VSFAKALERLRADVATAHKRKFERIAVQASDVEELLHHFDRLDAAAREQHDLVARRRESYNSEAAR
jgi:CBS-domain-containing membrane protein